MIRRAPRIRTSWDDLIRLSNGTVTEMAAAATRRTYLTIPLPRSSSSCFPYFHLFLDSRRSVARTPLYSTSKLASLSTSANAGFENEATPMDVQKAYGLLKLSEFSQSEIDWRFDQIVRAGNRDHELTSIANASLDDDDDALQSSEEQVMHQSDLEAYLFQRYLSLEDRWNDKHNSNDFMQQNDLFDNATISDSRQIQLQFEKAMEVHTQQQKRISRIRECAERDASSLFQLLSLQQSIQQSSRNTSTIITKHQFHNTIHNLATQIHHPTILPLAASMLLVGSSVGIISPILPFLVTQLNLTSIQYGTVVSSFALTKMLGNVPSAILVQRFGRKPFLVHSLWLVGFGVAGMGISDNWMELSACRMTIGAGVAALTTASTLMVADVSTPLSRGSAFGPIMSAFAAGTALGPAVGGMLCDAVGIRDTFLMVAMSYGVVGIWNGVSLKETRGGFWTEEGERLPWHEEIDNGSSRKDSHMDSVGMTTTVSRALKDTLDQWSTLIRDPNVRPLVIMNGFYMMAFSGVQMTLLPLLLTNGGPNTIDTGMALTATAMGYVYMWMSAVAVVGNPAAGIFADRVGKNTAIIAGGILTSAGMAALPLACAYGLMTGDLVSLDPNDVNWPLLAANLGIWSLGSALLGTSHVRSTCISWHLLCLLFNANLSSLLLISIE